MKKKNGIWVLLSAVFAFCMLTGCEEEDDNMPDDVVLAVSDNTMDFSTYKTFTVMEASVDDGQTLPEDLPAGNVVTLNNAIAAELKAIGLKQVTEDADLLVGALIRTSEVDAVVTGYWYDYYYGWYWGYYDVWYDAELVTFDVGTLIIDAVDVKDPEEAEDDRLVFRGAYSGVMYDDAEDASDRINAAVEKIFKQWPLE